MSRSRAFLTSRPSDLKRRYVRRAPKPASAGSIPVSKGGNATVPGRRLRLKQAEPEAALPEPSNRIPKTDTLRWVSMSDGPRLCVRDTGVAVSVVVDWWSRGFTREAVHRMCPCLTAADLTACAEFGLREQERMRNGAAAA